MPQDLKPRSPVITDGPDRAPSRAMLKAVGSPRQSTFIAAAPTVTIPAAT